MTNFRALTEEEGTLGSILRVPFEAMLSHNYGRIRELGFDDVRVAHGAVLRNIAAGGSRVTDLATRAGMTKQSMAELVKYLSDRGYVDVEQDPEDRRGRLVTLTQKGQAVFRALVEASNEFEELCAQRIGRAKWAEFKAVTQEVVVALEAIQLAASGEA